MTDLGMHALERLLAGGTDVQATRAAKGPKRRKRAAGHSIPVYRCQLVEERRLAVSRLHVRRPSECAALIWTHLGQPDRELFVVVLLDIGNAVLGINTVAIGCAAEVLVHPREVFKPAILYNADRIVVAHNHVNGDVRPSTNDRKLTRRLVKAGRAVGIQVSDHLILGRSPRERFSFLDSDLMPAPVD